MKCLNKVYVGLFCFFMTIPTVFGNDQEGSGSGKSGGNNKERFQNRKTMVLKEVEEHIQKLQAHKSCVSAASDHDAMKQCHEQMKQWRESRRNERNHEEH